MRTSRMVLVVALATVCTLAIEASARDGRGGSDSGHGGGRSGGGYSGAKPGWSGHGHGWQGSRHHGHHGHQGHNYRWRGHGHYGYRYYPGYYGYRYYPGYYYPAWGVGVGLGLTWPWWGWGYQSYPHPYPYPAGVVVERSEPIYVAPETGPLAFRWYCPPVAAYHPDVLECAQPWLKVLPPDAGPAAPSSPSTPSAPPAPVPRSSAPADEQAWPARS